MAETNFLTIKTYWKNLSDCVVGIGTKLLSVVIKDSSGVEKFTNENPGVINGAVSLNGSMVIDNFSGSANVTRTYANYHDSLEVINDSSTTNLSFTVDSLIGRTFTVAASEIFDEVLPPFKVITITTTVTYRAKVRGGIVEAGVNS